MSRPAKFKDAIYQSAIRLFSERGLSGTGIREIAKEAGVSDEALAEVFALQRKAMWRLDYISSENSQGFHSDQEAARILGESIDYSRQAQAAALRLLAGGEPATAGRAPASEGPPA